MENQEDLPSSTWATRGEPVALTTTAQNISADASLDANEIENGSQGGDARSAVPANSDRGVVETIAFESQDDVYTWPFELCRSYEMIKPLIVEVYTLKRQAYLGEEVKKGRYDIRTKSGAVILPSVWAALVQPFTTIKISFWNAGSPNFVPPSTPRDTREYRHVSYEDAESAQGGAQGSTVEPGTYDDVVEVDVDIPSPSRAPPPPRRIFRPRATWREDDENRDSRVERAESETHSESTDSSGTDEEQTVSLKEDWEPEREVTTPIDADGNKLAFTVDTSRIGQTRRVRKELERKVTESKGRKVASSATEGQLTTLSITKALLVQAATKTLVVVHTLPGPKVHPLQEGTTMTWYHVQAEQLDFSRFKQVCLGIPEMSDRLRMLARELLAKIEKHRIKNFQNGFFVEPGTVLRADEINQAAPQSAIFSCIPYFDLQPLAKLTTTPKPGDRLFPPRTLMQSYYSHEDVRERDSEQAYKKFGNAQPTNLVYVPNMWLMNVGTSIVVTCGHKPLAEEMIKSIALVEEDLRELGTKDLKKASLTNIRLTDWDSNVHLYQLDACRSYFQMEQKIRDLRLCTSGVSRPKSLRMAWGASEDRTVVTPKMWSAIIERTDLVFIDLVSMDEKTTEEAEASIGVTDVTPAVLNAGVPPFFHWPSATGKEDTQPTVGPRGANTANGGSTLQCLEFTEKAMLNMRLERFATTNEVDGSFESSKFYETLPEITHEHVNVQFNNLVHSTLQASNDTYHATLVFGQHAMIVEKAARLWNLLWTTMRLFVNDTEIDESVILRKLWGAMSNVYSIITEMQKRNAMNPNSTGTPSPKGSGTGTSGWYVRCGQRRATPLADADKTFERSLRHCRQCRRRRPFNTPEAAMTHLRVHLKSDTVPWKLSTGDHQGSPPAIVTQPIYDAWIVEASQLRRELSNAGTLKILTRACDDASRLFQRINELADGVRNEDGNKSHLYRFPRKLHEAFRKLIVFYLAVERALHFTEARYQKSSDDQEDDSGPRPYDNTGLEVLKRFAKGVLQSVALSRQELCNMVMPDTLPDPMRGLSLGPEYVCGWLMRRLLVKPLEGHATIGDMYREYLSKTQFQVNHRPGKRLIRSINLIQEELQVIIEVNTWQTKLIDNYMCVLDDAAYEQDRPSRKAMFHFERELLESCRDNLALSREEYVELFTRCGPLSDRTKQSLEINEEDHGKAIMVFTVVTIIFLPLSFVTSFLGMNTVDIRDMNSGQSLFWAIAIPLAAVTMGSTMFIGYNGDELRDTIVSAYRTATGKQRRSPSTYGGITSQQKRPGKSESDSNSSINDTSLIDDAEYANPRSEYSMEEVGWANARGRQDTFDAGPTAVSYADVEEFPQPRANLYMQRMSHARFTTLSAPRERRTELPVPTRMLGATRHASAVRSHIRPRNDDDEWELINGAEYSGRHRERRGGLKGDEALDDYDWINKHGRCTGGPTRPCRVRHR